MKEQDKVTVQELNETEISNMPHKEFKVIVIKIVPGLRKEWVNSELQHRDRKYKKESIRAEEFNN